MDENTNKKMLVWFGSPHSQGHTRQLLEAFLGPFKKAGWEIKELDTYAADIRPCLGCGVCGKTGECVMEDFDPIDKALRSCDFLTVASPVYNDSFPAPLKAVLDRTQRYFEARFTLGQRPPIRKHRKAALLLTMGSDQSFPVEVTTHQLKQSFTVMNTELSGCAVWQGINGGEEGKAEALQKAERLALEILSGMC